MKKLLFPILALILALGLVVSTATPALAATTTLNPSAAGSATNLNRTGGTANWDACSSSDGETSYVYWTTNGTAWNDDLYALPDPALSGTINSVTVYMEAARDDYAGTKQDGAKTAIRTYSTTYYGTPIELTRYSSGGYVTYSTTYLTNPNTLSAWTLTEVNNLEAGVSLRSSGSGTASIMSRCTHVWVAVTYNEIGLNPNAAGDSTALGLAGAATNWQACQTSDGNTSYVINITEGSTSYDLYNLDNHGTASGLINSVTVYVEALQQGSGSTAQPVIKTGGTEYRPGAHSLTTSYVDYSDTWTTNPKTGGDWSWTDIDALQAGVELYTSSGMGTRTSRCTHVWVVVDYTPAAAVVLPTVTTQAVSGIGIYTATGNGNITNTGGENCTKRGVCWNTTGSPTVADSTSEEAGSFGTGSFTRSMTGLTAGTLYYVKAYAYNSAGYGYGGEVTFTTKPDGPTDLTATTAGTYQINLAWTKGAGAVKTRIQRDTSDYPAPVGAGTLVYFDTGTSFPDTGLLPNTTYYYTARSWVEGSDVWSDSFAIATATTDALTPTTVTITTQPAGIAPDTVDNPLSTQPVVNVDDQNGDDMAGVTVTALVYSGTPGALRNNTAVTDGSGDATFTTLGYNKSGEVFSIYFTADSASSAESDDIGPLAPGAAVSIVISPDDAIINVGDTQAYTATSLDTYGNPVADVTTSTTFAIVGGGDGGSWADNVYTSANAGTWTVRGTQAAGTDDATLYVYGVHNLTKGIWYPAIQPAIDDADLVPPGEPGNIIEVSPGTYSEDITILDKSLTLRSTGGAAATTIAGDGDITDTTVTINLADMGAGQFIVVFDGFTVTYAYTLIGLETVDKDSTLTIKNCILYDSTVVIYSSGSTGDNGTVIIENNEISYCTDGIYFLDVVNGSEVTIRNNNIHDNGHGIYLYQVSSDSTVTIKGNTITNNLGLGSGVHLEAGVHVDNVHINFNNITGNVPVGVYYNPADGLPLDATNNWWGDAGGPGADLDEDGVLGDGVSGPVNFTPWLAAEVTSQFVEDGTPTVNAKDNAATEVIVTGSATVTVAKYSGNPGTGPGATFGGDIGKYVDVFIDDPSNVTEIEIRLYYTAADLVGPPAKDETTLRLRWWDGDSWENITPPGNSGVNTANTDGYLGYMWAKITNATIPDLNALTGTPFGGSGAAPAAPAAPTVGVGGGGGGGWKGDITPPIISDVGVGGVTETTADFSWITNEPCTSQAKYRASPAVLSLLDETLVTEHLVQLTGLTPGTTYRCQAMSKDAKGNQAVSPEYTFTTLGEAPAPTPPVTPEEPTKPFNWPMVGGIIAGVIIVGLIVFFLVRRSAY